ncbi:hypothetical protein [Paenibacillus sp. FSL R7-0652]|jgi:hypothetical protein|uniref:Uncharacterized protein n=1 Tax=Paenibacillus sp. AN1007 TaxID=3151385 RepID=A0AAU8NIQ6_9BACL
MELELRTVVYAKKVEIRNVPVFACADCISYEVLQPVKTDLTECISKLGDQPVKQDVSFGEQNELADLFHEQLLAWPDASDQEMEYRMKEAVEERINLLLDIMGCAHKTGDKAWAEDTERRLGQLSGFVWHAHFSNAV